MILKRVDFRLHESVTAITKLESACFTFELQSIPRIARWPRSINHDLSGLEL